jgi:hypothetical protein
MKLQYSAHSHLKQRNLVIDEKSNVSRDVILATPNSLYHEVIHPNAVPKANDISKSLQPQRAKLRSEEE